MKMALKNYLQNNNNDDELQKLFYNMSKTMKYIHSHDYYIDKFNVDNIFINDIEKLTPIQFDELQKIDYDNEEQLIQKNIQNMAMLQVGVYTGLLPYMSFNNDKYLLFLKENFNAYQELLPISDVRYYNSVIRGDAFVYYSDFKDRSNQLELEELQKELKDSSPLNAGNSKGIQKTKATAAGILYAGADKETKKLYENLNDRQQAAFTSFLILPITMILLGVIISIITFIF